MINKSNIQNNKIYEGRTYGQIWSIHPKFYNIVKRFKLNTKKEKSTFIC
jgi:hypothetical protein